MKDLKKSILESTSYTIHIPKEDQMTILRGMLKFYLHDIQHRNKKDWERLKAFIDLQDGWDSKEFTERAFMNLYDNAYTV